MPQLNDAKFDAFRTQLFTGALNDMELQWLQANGATSGCIPDAWLEMLVVLGYTTGTRQDRWFAFLRASGFVGTINDMELVFFLNGGDPGAPDPTPPTPLSISYTKAAAWTDDGSTATVGNFTFTAGGTFQTLNPQGLIIGNMYRLTFTASAGTGYGSMYMRPGDFADDLDINADGDYDHIFEAQDTNGLTRFSHQDVTGVTTVTLSNIKFYNA